MYSFGRGGAFAAPGPTPSRAPFGGAAAGTPGGRPAGRHVAYFHTLHALNSARTQPATGPDYDALASFEKAAAADVTPQAGAAEPQVRHD
eukprot:812559-Prorocentrum_minimum.AAC.1